MIHGRLRPQTQAIAGTSHFEALISKIENFQAVVSVIGLGYVGLPLAVTLAEAGFRVVGIDVDERRVEDVNRGESYLSDVSSERPLESIRSTSSDSSTSKTTTLSSPSSPIRSSRDPT